MNRETARGQLKEQLKSYVESITKKSKGNMYVCPLCGSGSGKNGTGAFSIKDGTSWKCFSCNKGGDIFDLIGEIENIKEYGEQLKKAGELFGINIDRYRSTAREDFSEEYQNPPKSEQHTHNNIHIGTYRQAHTDYTDFFREAHSHISETDYPQRRGLSQEVIDRFNLGYIAEWRHPKVPNAPTSPRLIIPTGKGSYLARDTRADIPESQKAYSKSKVGSIQIFNSEALFNAKKPVFIVEGELDALSIITVGGEAVALGSTVKAKALFELLKANKPKQPLIISLDNDKAGKEATETLENGLKELDILAYRYNPAEEYKDANEALQKNRERFTTAISDAEQLLQDITNIDKAQYLKTNAESHLQAFINGIAESVNTDYISTGFPTLDHLLDGGLYEGLYIVGAISSLGKTTLITQIADQIAQSGIDVLIFSLEMARAEIMAKSISRHTIQEVLATGGNTQNAKTVRGITTGKRYKNYNEEETKLIKNAVKSYGEYAKHIYINEGIGDIGVKQIRETIRKHIDYTGNIPVVVVDYLQILAPADPRSTDKQNTDKAVLELKRISRDYKTPVIGISSFNRENYKNSVTMEAFKESGAIEYSSDVLIGLQLRGAGVKDFDVNEAKRKSPREVELVLLKNRNGATGDKVNFKYYAMFNYFTEG